MKQKNYQNSTKNTLGKLPIWNLKDLYESPKAKKLNNDLNKLRISTKKFEKKYASKITKISSNQLLKAIIELEDIDTKIDKIMSYAHLLVAEDGNNEKNKEKVQNGLLFKNQTSEDIFDTISWFEDKKLWREFKPENLNEYSQKFSIEKFLTKINFSINKAWDKFN